MTENENAPKERTLYEFDWNAGWAGKRETGKQVGWWNGRHWTAIYGDGMWSPQYVTAWRELTLMRDASDDVDEVSR